MEGRITKLESEMSLPHPRHPTDACGSGSQTGHVLATLAPTLSIIEWLPLLVCKAKHHVRVWTVEPSTLTYANSYLSRSSPATDFVGKAPCKSTNDMDGWTESTGRLLPFFYVVALVPSSVALSRYFTPPAAPTLDSAASRNLSHLTAQLLVLFRLTYELRFLLSSIVIQQRC